MWTGQVTAARSSSGRASSGIPGGMQKRRFRRPILRTGWLCQAEYEWAQHVLIGRRSGIRAEEIEQISEGPEATGWSDGDAALVRAVDELHADAMIGEETWTALAERYSKEQLMDLVFTVGQYNLVSMALNTLGVQLDDGLEGFPR